MKLTSLSFKIDQLFRYIAMPWNGLICKALVWKSECVNIFELSISINWQIKCITKQAVKANTGGDSGTNEVTPFILFMSRTLYDFSVSFFSLTLFHPQTNHKTFYIV